MSSGISLEMSVDDIAAAKSLQKHVWRARSLSLSGVAEGTSSSMAKTGKSKP